MGWKSLSKKIHCLSKWIFNRKTRKKYYYSFSLTLLLPPPLSHLKIWHLHYFQIQISNLCCGKMSLFCKKKKISEIKTINRRLFGLVSQYTCSSTEKKTHNVRAYVHPHRHIHAVISRRAFVHIQKYPTYMYVWKEKYTEVKKHTHAHVQRQETKDNRKNKW